MSHGFLVMMKPWPVLLVLSFPVTRITSFSATGLSVPACRGENAGTA